jgi:hypothetical protein
MLEEDFGEVRHEHGNLLTAPKGRYAYIWHVIVYPLKFLFFYTMVDCRQRRHRHKYGRIITICGLYLILLSYIMILCCDLLGNFFHTTPTVMGLTLSAVGKSGFLRTSYGLYSVGYAAACQSCYIER